jgi:hypothetical protein
MPHNAFPLSPPNTGTCRPSISYVFCCLPSTRPDHVLPLSRRTSLLRSARWSEYPNCCIAYFLGTSGDPPWAITASYNAHISHRTTKIHQPPDQNARRRAAHTLRTVRHLAPPPFTTSAQTSAPLPQPTANHHDESSPPKRGVKGTQKQDFARSQKSARRRCRPSTSSTATPCVA